MSVAHWQFLLFFILFDLDHSGVTTVSRFLEGSGPSRGARARRRFYYPTLSRVIYTCLSTLIFLLLTHYAKVSGICQLERAKMRVGYTVRTTGLMPIKGSTGSTGSTDSTGLRALQALRARGPWRSGKDPTPHIKELISWFGQNMFALKTKISRYIQIQNV